MTAFDTVIRNGILVTETDQFRADIGIRAGKIAAIGEVAEGIETIDASGLLVLPGGVDTHCHIEQLRATAPPTRSVSRPAARPRSLAARPRRSPSRRNSRAGPSAPPLPITAPARRRR